MENQINVGDQNSQQVGQNPVNQLVQIPEKPKINYWMISTIILVIMVLLGGFYIASLLISNRSFRPNYNTLEPSPTQVFSSPSPVVKDQHLFNISSELAIRLPTRAVVRGKAVTIDNIEYEIDTSGNVAGLCPWNDYGSECVYTDETLPNIKTFRVWSDETGIFALNPQDINVDKYNINNFKIYKTKPNKVFATDEVNLWKTILKDIVVAKWIL